MGNMMAFTMYPVAEGVPLGPEMLGFFQFWFSFQTFVVLGMGISSFLKPGSDAITKDGYWEYIGDSPDAKKAKAVDPAVEKMKAELEEASGI